MKVEMSQWTQVKEDSEAFEDSFRNFYSLVSESNSLNISLSHIDSAPA